MTLWDKIIKACENPDTMLAELGKLKDDMDVMEAGHATLTEEVAARDKQIADLRDTNHKLFLRTGVAGASGDETPPDPMAGVNKITEAMLT